MQGFAGHHLRSLFGLGIGAELLYAFIIIVCSVMIYIGTKELYELSNHKGIYYFRQAFLFFAIAYFVRSVIKFMVLSLGVNGVIPFSQTTFGGIGLITQLLFVYCSSMAIFYLVFSVMWKQWKNYGITILHILAFALAIVSVISRDPLVYVWLNIMLLTVAMILVIVSYEQKKKGMNLYTIYGLLALFWVVNIFDTLVPQFFEGVQLFIYVASTGIFLAILYKVIKKTGND